MLHLCGVILVAIYTCITAALAGVAPPPWADVRLNPCAILPRGWQLLYWAADNTCYKIFQTGHPCPETMELSPVAASNAREGVIAECRCPPGKAQWPQDSRCYSLFYQTPCSKDQYFAPVLEETENGTRSGLRQGTCKPLKTCKHNGMIWWPMDDQCYRHLSRGPCSKGHLLTTDREGRARCGCEPSGDLVSHYWRPSGTCHEHYTRGPCPQQGHLFLPDGSCGCDEDLPHYYVNNGLCYTLGEIGPCPKGHYFKFDIDSVSTNKVHATCMCKDDHIYWQPDNTCYRLYTQGPCDKGQFLINSTTCIDVPCDRARLYFPTEQTCYRIGSQGPCQDGQVVTFDFKVRPSLDGISYHGLCGCASGNEKCELNQLKEVCPYGKVMMNGTCHMLYTQGPCTDGQWVVPIRKGKVELWKDVNNKDVNGGICDCKIGFRRSDIDEDKCLPPTIALATYLNNHVANFTN